jgi:hypothetical protein
MQLVPLHRDAAHPLPGQVCGEGIVLERQAEETLQAVRLRAGPGALRSARLRVHGHVGLVRHLAGAAAVQQGGRVRVPGVHRARHAVPLLRREETQLFTHVYVLEPVVFVFFHPRKTVKTCVYVRPCDAVCDVPANMERDDTEWVVVRELAKAGIVQVECG